MPGTTASGGGGTFGGFKAVRRSADCWYVCPSFVISSAACCRTASFCAVALARTLAESGSFGAVFAASMLACAPPSSRGMDDLVRAIASAAWVRKFPESVL
ncbi:hypothetical protein ACFWVU_14460 [Streptomyces sp. NPDC058686]|uniref:hypothetical protein n=1 Tax=Streptomyces sp. NPDC058686 TaxID=3346599 RepID=UPI0036563B7B